LSSAALRPFGWGDRWDALLTPGHQPARVVRHDGQLVVVATPELRALPVRATAGDAVVGDWVGLDGDVVAEVLPRTSLLRRAAPDGSYQAITANVDTVVVVCGLDRPVRTGRLQRSVATAWDAGAQPLIVFTKDDLDDSDAAADAARAVAAEAVPNADVLVTSTATGLGLDELAAACRDRTVVLLGESGAGKSSLTNALLGDDVAAVGAVRASDQKGRHTTTSRELRLLPGGGVIIDTPGIRALALWVDADAIDATFPEIEELAASCRFNDCGHSNEPGCAVRDAVDAERLEDWRSLRREVAARERPEHERRRAGRIGSKIIRDALRQKGREE
jgi:ribosome biogenesis GTPase